MGIFAPEAPAVPPPPPLPPAANPPTMADGSVQAAGSAARARAAAAGGQGFSNTVKTKNDVTGSSNVPTAKAQLLGDTSVA